MMKSKMLVSSNRIDKNPYTATNTNGKYKWVLVINNTDRIAPIQMIPISRRYHNHKVGLPFKLSGYIYCLIIITPFLSFYYFISMDNKKFRTNFLF